MNTSRKQVRITTRSDSIHQAEVTVRWYGRILGRLEEPAFITAAQVVTFILAATGGIVAVSGGFPYVLTDVLGPVALLVGAILVVGGVSGAWACIKGMWWLERISLLLCGLGWVLFIPSLLYVPLRPLLMGFFFILLGIALLDIYKRYRRIDWAYLDPTK